MSPKRNIPTIDLGDYLSGDAESRRRFVRTLGEGLVIPPAPGKIFETKYSWRSCTREETLAALSSLLKRGPERRSP